jgi:hypothetical protein
MSVFAVLVFLAKLAFAGGPFHVTTHSGEGVALRWQNNIVEWYLDPGPVSSAIDNSTGKQWVEEQFGKWEGVQINNSSGNAISTTNLQNLYKGNLDHDVDGSNYEDYINYKAGITAIIFDHNGDITADLMGESNRKNVVGLSAPLIADPTGLYITKGFALFNGAVLATEVLAKDKEIANKLFQVTILHEIGHLINLDHSQVNESVAALCSAGGSTSDRNGSCDGSQYIPTMYPELLAITQGELSRDDKVSVSWIYPTSGFNENFCTITGAVYDAEGNPLKGVNVIASRSGEGDGMASLDSRSFVSGAMQSGCTGSDSKYYLYGILPGKKYEVTYEPLNSNYSGSSGFEPCSSPPSGFDAGIIKSSNGSDTVSCSEAGKIIEMASQTIDVQGGGGNADGAAGGDSASSGGCGIGVAGAAGSGTFFVSIFMAISSAVILRRRRKFHSQ